MSSPEGFSATHLFLRLRPSGSHLLLHVGAVALALYSLAIHARISTHLTFFLAIAVLASSVYCLQRYVLLSHPSAVTEVILSGGYWQVRLADGRLLPAELARPVYTGTWFIVLNFRLNGAFRVPVVLARDALQSDVFRRSRVLFRLGL